MRVPESTRKSQAQRQWREPLSQRQAQVYREIVFYRELTHGQDCPGVYLSARLGITHARVRQHIRRLCEKGWLRSTKLPAFVA